jgi:hypothetical protein
MQTAVHQIKMTGVADHLPDRTGESGTWRAAFYRERHGFFRPDGQLRLRNYTGLHCFRQHRNDRSGGNVLITATQTGNSNYAA